MPIKDALVNTDSKATQEAVGPTKSSLQKVDMKLLDGKAHDRWMELVSPIENSLTKIAEIQDVEEQRKHFEILSENLIEAVEVFGISGLSIYKHYCPMAFRDQGAFWLSSEKEVLNPYFGDKMLTCGEMKEEY
jgi:Cu(I)/Ag(I) efflux system membrane fusion protein